MLVSEIEQLHSQLENSSVWCRAAAYVIIAPELPGQIRPCLRVGKIHIALPRTPLGTVHVFVYDCDGSPVQYGASTGFGFDKIANAMSGIIFDGIPLIDNGLVSWYEQLIALGYRVIRAI